MGNAEDMARAWVVVAAQIVRLVTKALREGKEHMIRTSYSADTHTARDGTGDEAYQA